jgi:manganese transport protein
MGDAALPLARPGAVLRRPLREAATFAGPAFLVSVGYMDPGNWGTDLAAGSEFGYRLLWVLVVSNVTAIFLQYLSAKVGIATGDHLAALIGARLSRAPRIAYWIVAETAMLATEMAEFLGVVVGLRLLLRVSLPVAIVLGAIAVLGLLATAGGSVRRIERAIFLLLGIVGGAYVLEVILSRPDGGPILTGAALPRLPPGALVVAAGILGATVMPHNLFLHSGLIISRRGFDVPRRVLRRATLETAVALNLALFVNAAILIMAAATFAPEGLVIDSLGEAHRTLRPLLGPLASGAFAIALLASGLASSTTGSIAGQLVIDGLLGWRVPVIARRAVTMIPAVIVLALGVSEVAALVWSLVILSVVLPAVVVPLVVISNDREAMGDLANGRFARRAAVVVVSGLMALNAALLTQVFSA